MRRRNALSLSLGVALATSGCAANAGRPLSSASPVQPPPLATATPEPSLHVFRPQGGMVTGGNTYQSFRQWASIWDRVAVARVVSIGQAQWNTRDGTLPVGLDFFDQVPGNDNVLVIMQPIRLELLRPVRGTWPNKEFYSARQGGRVGNDVYETRPDPADPRDLVVGDLAVVFGYAQPIDMGAAFPLTVLSYFPIDASGRVLTPVPDRTPAAPDQTTPPADPAGGITVDNIGQYADLTPPPPGPG